MKKFLWLIPVVHCVFAFSAFLIVPTAIFVYTGSPYFWKNWDGERTFAMCMYLVGSFFSAYATIMIRLN